MILVVDSTVMIDHQDLNAWGVEVVNYPMYLDSKRIDASMDMSEEAKEEIRLLLKDKKRRVNTSGLREEDLLAVFRKYPDEPILCLLQSSVATTASIQVISKVIKEHPELDITHYDSQHLASGYGVIAREAALRMQAGASREEMDAFLKAAPLRSRLFGVIYDLFYLKRNGRIGAVQAIMGTAMRIIPILTSTDPPGTLKSAGKVKKPAQAIRKIISNIEKDRELWPEASLSAIVSVVGPHKDEGEELIAAIKEHDPDANVALYGYSHSMLPHVGPDFFDVGYLLMDS